MRGRGVSVSRAASDLDLHGNVMRRWMREQAADSESAFPIDGVVKPEQQEIERLRCELARMNAGSDILQKKQRPTSLGPRYELRFVAKH